MNADLLELHDKIEAIAKRPLANCVECQTLAAYVVELCEHINRLEKRIDGGD